MPSAKVIKNRITSVKNTKKITNAMYLIASTKMRKAKLELDAARPYFDIVEREIKRIFETKSDVKSMYFYPETGRKPAERYAYLVITADKGLAGAYNHNIILAADEEMRRHNNVKLYVVGEYGRQ
ncbi:MAG: F0F1 ATP synthase subunit gamma, partial [Lachnospiraceae bacterium]|nr:F0F1 ATP synthase subunit gamma [Lachnospiraceae bacterium]